MSKYPFSCDRCGDLLILKGSPHNYDMVGRLGRNPPHLAAYSPTPGLAAQMCNGQYQRTHELFSFIINHEVDSQP